MMSRLSNNFFEKHRPNVKEINKKVNPDDKIVPIKWSKEVLEGKRKAMITLPKSK